MAVQQQFNNTTAATGAPSTAVYTTSICAFTMLLWGLAAAGMLALGAKCLCGAAAQHAPGRTETLGKLCTQQL